MKEFKWVRRVGWMFLCYKNLGFSIVTVRALIHCKNCRNQHLNLLLHWVNLDMPIPLGFFSNVRVVLRCLQKIVKLLAITWFTVSYICSLLAEKGRIHYKTALSSGISRSANYAIRAEVRTALDVKWSVCNEIIWSVYWTYFASTGSCLGQVDLLGPTASLCDGYFGDRYFWYAL